MNKLMCAALIGWTGAVGCGDDGPGDGPDEGTEISMAVVPAGKAGVNHVAFVAYQDGEGAWQAMTATDGVYKAKVQSEKYGIAIGCAAFPRFDGAPPAPSVTIYHWAIAEKTELTDDQCFEISRPHTLTGTLTGNGALANRTIEALDVSAALEPGGAYTLKLPAGKTDVFAWGENFAHTQTKIVRLRDVDPATASPLAIDLDTGATPVTETVTAPPLGSTSIGSALRTKEGAFVLFMNETQGPQFNTYRAPPASMLRPGDLIRVRGLRAGVASTDTSIAYLDAPAPISLVFAPSFQAAAPAVAQGATVSLTFGFTPVAATLPISTYLVSANAGAFDDAAQFSQSTTLSAGWLGATTPVSYSFPDLSSIPGWLPSMVILPRKEIAWQVDRAEANMEQYVAGRLFRNTNYSGVVGEYCGNERVEPAFEQCDPPNGTTCSATCQTITVR